MANFFDQFDAAEAPPSNRPKITITPQARELAIRTVLGEAANEPDAGMHGVAAVIRNRAQAGRYGGDSVERVVMAPNQFEPWGNPDGRRRMFSYPVDSDPYKRAAAAVDGVFGGEIDDPTNGATHFLNEQIVRQRRGGSLPGWAQGEGQSIGRHTFYAPEGRVNAVSSQSRKPAENFFDQFDSAPQSQPEMQGPPQRQVGMGEAIGRGIQQGASFNFSDELAGLKAASGIPETVRNIASAIPVVNMITPAIGAVRLGYEALTGQDAAAAEYARASEAERAANKLAQEQRPYSTMAGNVAGAVALPVGGVLNAATLPARVGRGIAVGAGAGALAGAGEGDGALDRATKAITGGAMGAGIGGLVPVAATAVEGVGRGIGAAIAPVTNRIGGAVAPERQAAKTAVEYLGKGAPELTQAEYTAAQAAGLPVANIDRGGEAGRALARWASNVSPEARDTIQKFADARFEGQAERAVQFLQNIAGTSGNTTVLRDALKGLSRIENAPAYRKAFSHPNAQAMWDEGFEQIAQAPVVQDAIRAASITGANKGTVEGFQRIRSPFVIDKQTGQLTLRVDENGNRVLPNLQFWNEVKINLDKSGTREAQMLNSALKSHLDNLVPDYKAARSGAARFFAAEDAMDAGQKFVHQNMALGEASKALSKMTPAERDMFKIGFASKLIDDIGNTRDRVNVINKISQSPNAKAKLQMVLGPNGYNQLDALISVEQSMDKLRGALGNSTTVRQMIEVGLAGGVGGSGIINADPTQLGIAAAIAGRRYVDQRVAKEIARMLTSNDPDVLAKGVKAVAGNKNLLAAFHNFDARLSNAASQQGPAIPIPGMARADSEHPASAQRF